MDFRRGQRREDPEINLIPMIDILLVIMIFLMVSTTFVHQHGLNIALPSGSKNNSELSREKSIEVEMTLSGMVSVDRHNWTRRPAELTSLLGDKLKYPGETYVVIRADKNLSHGSVMQVVSDFQGLGFNHFSLVTEDLRQ
ncbi:MAG: biopolymer transporter ExbD [Betaproteobacteria bacterium]|nr:biopolymer transporter ExbD [Betaproteobacteria bacterium]MDE2423733.1 biopolymer transporter ExbD [Betaproteobacteria bacterium]